MSRVKQVTVCGHYGCSGIKAAMTHHHFGIDNKWLKKYKRYLPLSPGKDRYAPDMKRTGEPVIGIKCAGTNIRSCQNPDCPVCLQTGPTPLSSWLGVWTGRRHYKKIVKWKPVQLSIPFMCTVIYDTFERPRGGLWRNWLAKIS